MFLAWIVEVTPQPIERFTQNTSCAEPGGALALQHCLEATAAPQGSGRGGEDLNSIPDMTFSRSNNKSMAIICASAPLICIMSVMILIYLTGAF